MANWGYGGKLPMHNASISRFSTGTPEPVDSRSHPTPQLPVLPPHNHRPHAHSGGAVGVSPSNGVMGAPHQYNPAALLNPRGGYQEMRQQQTLQHAPFNQPPQDFNFQFDSPSSHGHPTQLQQTNGTIGAGMGGMVERMHNVSERSQVQPTKRQKIHDFGREIEGRDASGFDVLGSYMREQREIGRRDENKSSVVNLEGQFDRPCSAFKK